MKRLLSVFLALILLASPAIAGWGTKPESPKEAESKTDESITYAKWEGQIDTDFLNNVRRTLESALNDKKIKTLNITLYSPGGYATESIESARLVRSAVKRGLVVEIHGVGLVASGATFILAAGTPGKRYMNKWALFLIHPPQVGGGFFEAPVCGKFVDAPKTVREKIVNVVILLMRDSYIEYTGKSQKEVEDWLTCDNEQVGTGKLAKDLGFVDVVE